MRIPSIRLATDAALRVWIRFPLVLLSGFLAAGVGIVLAGNRSEPLMAMMAAATLGLPLFTALSLASERLVSRAPAIGLAIAGVALLVAFAWLWPTWTEEIRLRRYAQLSIAFHLTAAFLPYLSGREPNGFWQYNRMLFLRFFSAGVHSAVLFGGLALALLALDQLFDVNLPERTYIRLWLLVAFVFNTWFFLGGVPADLPALEQRRDYPRALEVFSQFILIPLVVIYLAILTAYLGRVLLTGNWPSNFIGFPVSIVATFGIFSLLLVYPLRDDESHRWIGRYARWFFLALLPAVGMLLAAIWKRIGQYGVTEDRYFLAVLGAWLAAIALLFLARSRTSIRWIPITLCALALVTFAGPLGAYSVSRHSQISRLRSALEANGLFARGEVRPATGGVPFATRKEIGNILQYLLQTHGRASLQGLLGTANVALVEDSLSGSGARSADRTNDVRQIMANLGMTYVSPYEGVESRAFYYQRHGAPMRAVSVLDADYHVRLDGSLPAPFQIAGETWRLDAVPGRLALITPRDTVRFPMEELIDFAHARIGLPDTTEATRFTARSDGITAVLVPNNYSGVGRGDSAQVHMMSADLYLTLPGSHR
ncbi:MAG: DUF4153 domain-containing protein [Candidatus Eiseniibacteriota bacterium]